MTREIQHTPSTLNMVTSPPDGEVLKPLKAGAGSPDQRSGGRKGSTGCCPAEATLRNNIFFCIFQIQTGIEIPVFDITAFAAIDSVGKP